MLFLGIFKLSNQRLTLKGESGEKEFLLVFAHGTEDGVRYIIEIRVYLHRGLATKNSSSSMHLVS